MHRRAFFMVLILFILLGHARIFGAVHPEERRGYPGSGRLFSVSENSKPSPQADEYRQLKKELERLMEEIKRLEKEVKNKLSKEIIPLIRREIRRLRERLREKLREFGIEEKDPGPKKI